MLDYKPCYKFVMIQQFFTSILFSQPLLRGGSLGSSLGSYKGSSGRTSSLSSPRHYSQQFGTPLRSQGTGNKLDRTPARLENIFGIMEFLKLYRLGSCLQRFRHLLCVWGECERKVDWLVLQVTLCLHSHHSVDFLSSIFIAHLFPVYFPPHVSLGEDHGLFSPTEAGNQAFLFSLSQKHLWEKSTGVLLVNSQLVCLLPVEIFNYVRCIWNTCFLCFIGMPVNKLSLVLV